MTTARRDLQAMAASVLRRRVVQVGGSLTLVRVLPLAQAVHGVSLHGRHTESQRGKLEKERLRSQTDEGLVDASRRAVDVAGQRLAMTLSGAQVVIVVVEGGMEAWPQASVKGKTRRMEESGTHLQRR